MRKLTCVLAAVAIRCPTLCGQGATTAQTARQALLQMFFSKTQGGIAKHLPAATLAALEKSGAITSLEEYWLSANQFETQGNNSQIFETGAVLLSGKDPKSGRKVVVMVDNDSLRGEEDDIELFFLTTRTGSRNVLPLCRA